jgi:[protein-PII] uridylyltransferase
MARTGLTGLAFCRAYAGLVDDWVGALAAAAGIVEGSSVALVAVGGYGRRELCPASDLDLTLVHRSKRDLSSVAERVWYPVWDAGVGLDHSVRTLKQALAITDEDLKVALGLLDARLVAGDRGVFEELSGEVAVRWRKRAQRWLADLADRVDERHAAAGEVAFLLEPDLKEGRRRLRAAHSWSTIRGRIPLWWTLTGAFWRCGWSCIARPVDLSIGSCCRSRIRLPDRLAMPTPTC